MPTIAPSKSEIYTAIKDLTSSAGFDGIPAGFYKANPASPYQLGHVVKWEFLRVLEWRDHCQNSEKEKF